MGKESLSKKELKQKKKKRTLIIKTVVLVLLLVVLGICVFFLVRTLKKDQESQSSDKKEDVQTEVTPEVTPEAAPVEDTAAQPEADKAAVMEEAAYLAATYDYDGAIEKLNSLVERQRIRRLRRRWLNIRQRKTVVYQSIWMKLHTFSTILWW